MRFAALYTQGRCVTGRHHGEAFARLSEAEQNRDFKSGFLDIETGRFAVEGSGGFYLKRLVMMRHGQTESDGLDPPVSESGKQHIYQVANFLSQLDLSDYVAFTSPLLRCRQSAIILSKKIHLDFSIDENIREMEDDELLKDFRQRIEGVLDHLPRKSILISHCDFILHSTYIATGESLNLEKRNIPTSSMTVIDNDKVLCFGEDYNHAVLQV